MKSIFRAGLALTMACFLFMSCQKSNVEPQAETNFLSSAENRAALANRLKAYFDEKGTASRGSSNRAQFIVPFFSSESMGVVNFDPANFKLELASFSADLSGSDFYRENPDGTISVHVNSNTALAEYYENIFDPSALVLYGNNRARFTANYTGELVEFPFTDDEGNVIFFFRFVDTSESGRAVSLHGNGNVGPNGAGPWKKLAAKVVVTPSGQAEVELSLK